MAAYMHHISENSPCERNRSIGPAFSLHAPGCGDLVYAYICLWQALVTPYVTNTIYMPIDMLIISAQASDDANENL